MKKIGIILMVFGISIASAQKIGYIEIDRILEKMPEYEKANNEINAQVEAWESELDGKFETIENMYQEFVNSQATLSEDMRQQKQNAIIEGEKKANQFKDEKFGRDGELTKLQGKKLKPIYDVIYTAAEEVAKNEGFDHVFDKSGDSNWIYSNPAMDLTEKVIEALGL